MARPSKCRMCGYRFKDNEDICPECFTSRDDDISCEQFSTEEHSHGNGFYTTHDSDIYDEFSEKSFIDEQKQAENEDPIPNATYGGKFGTPPPTYAQQSYRQNENRNTAFRYNSGRVNGSDRLDRLNAIKNGTFTPRDMNMAMRQGFNSGSQFYTRDALQQRQRSKVAVTIAVLVFITAFFMPVIIGIVSASNYAKNSKSTTTERPLKNFSYEFSKPDISMPDFKSISVNKDGYKLTANKIKMYIPFDLNTASDIVGSDVFKGYNLFNDKYAGKCRFVDFNLNFEPSDDNYFVDWDNITVEARYFTDGAISLSQVSSISNVEENVCSIGYFTAVGSLDYIIHVPVENKNTDHEEIIDLTVNVIRYTEVKDSYGTEALDAAADKLSKSEDRSADAEGNS